MAKRHPESLPQAMITAIENDDRQAIERLLDEWRITYSFTFNVFTTPPVTHVDADTKSVRINVRSLLGPWAFLFSGYACMLAYFTLCSILLRGGTPGKRLLRMRVVRLDGRRLSLWNAFGRAGGYSASISTLGAGFLQVLWDPNRQTLHDKIAGTVVVLDRAVKVHAAEEKPVAVPSPSRRFTLGPHHEDETQGI